MLSNSYSIFRTGLALLPCLAITAACGDQGEPYIEPLADPEITISAAQADSLWGLYTSTHTFTDAADVAPSEESLPYYDDYCENWLQAESTRDVLISFSDDTATVEFQGADTKKTKKFVHISTRGAHVTIVNDSVIDSVAEGRARMNYILQGQSKNGSLRVYSNKKFMVTLNNVSLSNAEGAAINVQKSFEKKRMFLELPKGTQNYLADASVYTDTVAGEDDKGALFSEGKIIFQGEGSLEVSGNRSHAIAADDRIHIHKGVQLRVKDAVKDGIHAKDGLVLSGGSVRVFAQKDAIQCDSTSTGLLLRGAQLLVCGKRSCSAAISYEAGQFCLIGTDITEASEIPGVSLPDYSKFFNYGIIQY